MRQTLTLKMFAPLDSRALALVIAESAISMAFNCISLVGNLMVCFIMYRSTRRRLTVANLYISALAITDLLSATVIMPMTTGSLIRGRWIFGDVACNIHGFVMHFSLYASASTIALTAVNRYATIAKPGLAAVMFTKKRSWFILVSVWLAVILYIIIPIFAGWSKFTFHPGHTVCLAKFTSEEGSLIHYSIIIPLFVLFPLVLSSFSYYKISRVIKQHNLQVASSLTNRRFTLHEIQVTKSIFVVAFVFVICWVPTWVVVAVYRFKIAKVIPRNATLLCTFLFFTSNSLNPLIYAGMSSNLRREFLRILQCGRNITVSSAEAVQQNEIQH